MALLLPLLILASSLTSSIASAFLWNFCDANAGNFDNNSTYSSNLNLTRSTLSSSISGFATKIEGNIPNRVYSLVLCRGDTDAFECLSCISTAASIIQKNCTNYKDAVIWYDNCQLRYSNKDFLTAPDITYFKQLINSQLISDDQLQQLETQTTALLTKMTDLAVRDSSHYFATGETALNGTDVVFALVQCARDLPSGDCQWCLQKAMAEITDSLIRWRGGRVLGMWCNMRYELYKFYNGTSLVQQSASSLPPAASSQPPTGGPSNTRSPADSSRGDSTRSKLLDWDKRYKIIGGIARGLLYMHEDSQPKIIHRDLKAGNVLLAANMNPTISDFGTARLFSDDEPKG